MFFIGDDGVNGTELWKSDGTAKGTQRVKDLTPGVAGSTINNLVSFGGKLFFTNDGVLWSSDGSSNNTKVIDDAGIDELYVYNIVTAKDKLFLSGYTYKYGIELFEGKLYDKSEKFVMSKITDKTGGTNPSFKAILYPNPSSSNATVQVTGNTKGISVSITDIKGKKLWQSVNSSARIINLPTEKYVAGIYVVTVTSGTESKTITMVKQ